jgi:hypothetical protein
MAYADAFGAALARAQGATLWTGDPELLVDGSSWMWRDIRPHNRLGVRPHIASGHTSEL